MFLSSLGSGPQVPVTDSAHHLIWSGLALILLFFAGFGGWAAVATIQSAVLADGEVAVEGARQPVQHRDGGIVREVLVREGDLVRKGDVLLRLDATETRASLIVLMIQMDGLLTREARLLAEADGAAAIVWPEALAARRQDAAVTALLDEERRLFEVRRAAFQGELDLNRRKMAQLRGEMAGAEAQRKARLEQLALIGKELEGQQDLFGKGYARKTRIFELQRAMAGLEGQVAEAETVIAQAGEQIRTAAQEADQMHRRRSEEVAAAQAEVRRKIAELAPRLDALREQLARTVLVAPETGRVMGLAVIAPGNVIGAGDKVMEIVPDAESLTIDVQVHPEDIEDVREGMPADIRLLAFKDITIPEVPGRVTRVSPDRMLHPRTGLPYYAVRVAVTDPGVLHTLKLRLQPGMPVAVLLSGTTRTVLNYLLWPMRQQLADAFREK